MPEVVTKENAFPVFRPMSARFRSCRRRDLKSVSRELVTAFSRESRASLFVEVDGQEAARRYQATCVEADTPLDAALDHERVGLAE
jgi:hypothetical protein